MPIRIDKNPNDNAREEVAWICDDEWELPSQIDSLEKWLQKNHQKLDKGPYVADIGFSPRPGASGGGAVLTVEAMKIMISINMEIFFSEYSEFEDDEQKKTLTYHCT